MIMKPTIPIMLFALAILAIACAAPTQRTGPAGDTVTGPDVNAPDPVVAPAPDPVPPTPTNDDPAVTPAPAAQQVNLVAYRWGWEPSTVTVKKGVPVVITVTSRSGTHGLAIPALGVNSGTFGVGETKTVEFTPDKAGEYPFFCSVFCGEGHSEMRGTLVVTE
jgi:heme/copper-type cytochrome/quinol oxidase subunit 2